MKTQFFFHFHFILSVESESFLNVAAEYEKELIGFNGVYDQPWTRISPYLLGLCLGYILHRTKRQLKMHIIVVVLGKLFNAYYITLSNLC